MSKKVYRITNWKDYNRSLINRGNLTIWISDDLQASWYEKPGNHRKPPGRPRTYGQACLETALTLRSLFRLPRRATQGFLEGLLQMLALPLRAPTYSQLSRRASGMSVRYFSKTSKNAPTDLVVDSTGLKIYGEGEWKMRTHGKQKRRTWRKLHLAVNPNGMEIVAMELTAANIHDDCVMPKLLQKQKIHGDVFADGAYVSKACFDAIATTGGGAKIALRTGTGIAQKNPSPGQQLRNSLIREIQSAGGKVAWKKSSGYHRRSLAETGMFRWKTILGAGLSSRVLENQVTEAKIKASILNRISALGMPVSRPRV